MHTSTCTWHSLQTALCAEKWVLGEPQLGTKHVPSSSMRQPRAWILPRNVEPLLTRNWARSMYLHPACGSHVPGFCPGMLNLWTHGTKFIFSEEPFSPYCVPQTASGPRDAFPVLLLRAQSQHNPGERAKKNINLYYAAVYPNRFGKKNEIELLLTITVVAFVPHYSAFGHLGTIKAYSESKETA
ncbi:hypothetical protein E5288_WYG007850 [Bos mutus]|uniref:Uncharacterized protein n=1 Tax=Bos mutus TaxID=72004 RepID=A0A6B0RG07_9CETA|nr:hypothetical protein [Bos mutus]